MNNKDILDDLDRFIDRVNEYLSLEKNVSGSAVNSALKTFFDSFDKYRTANSLTKNFDLIIQCYEPIKEVIKSWQDLDEQKKKISKVDIIDKSVIDSVDLLYLQLALVSLAHYEKGVKAFNEFERLSTLIRKLRRFTIVSQFAVALFVCSILISVLGLFPSLSITMVSVSIVVLFFDRNYLQDKQFNNLKELASEMKGTGRSNLISMQEEVDTLQELSLIASQIGDLTNHELKGIYAKISGNEKLSTKDLDSFRNQINHFIDVIGRFN